MANIEIVELKSINNHLSCTTFNVSCFPFTVFLCCVISGWRSIATLANGKAAKRWKLEGWLAWAKSQFVAQCSPALAGGDVDIVLAGFRSAGLTPSAGRDSLVFCDYSCILCGLAVLQECLLLLLETWRTHATHVNVGMCSPYDVSPTITEGKN